MCTMRLAETEGQVTMFEQHKERISELRDRLASLRGHL